MEIPSKNMIKITINILDHDKVEIRNCWQFILKLCNYINFIN